MNPSSPPDETAVRAEIAQIVDPCSTSTEHPISIVDLGLVRAVEIGSGGDVRVRLGTTGPGCLYYPDLMRAIERAVADIPGVASVHVELDNEFTWDASAMAPEARARRDAVLLGKVPGLARPRAWKESAT